MITLREVILTDNALLDLYELDYTIRQEYQAPLTAERYLTGLKKSVQALSHAADLRVVQSGLSREYGKDIRRENYKEMAILYTIEEDKVFVLRIIPQSLVIY